MPAGGRVCLNIGGAQFESDSRGPGSSDRVSLMGSVHMT